jgi:nucleoside triphosphatase
MRQRVVVVPVLQRADAAVLLCRMPAHRGAYPGEWGLPGGGIEPGETIEAALRRETREELGLELATFAPAFWSERVRDKRYPDGRSETLHMVFLVFRCTAAPGEVALNEELDEAAWVPPGDLHRYALNEATRETLTRLGLRVDAPTPFSNSPGGGSEQAQRYMAAVLDLLGDREPLAVQAELVPALRAAITGVPIAELTTPEAPGKWSVAQVVDHLADQEIVNAHRLRAIVAEDRPRIGRYDQERWAARLRYGSAGAEVVLEELDAMRRRNLRLYAALSPAEWERVGEHAERGEVSVRRQCALTAGHDLLHRRQVARILTALRG